MLTLKKDSWVLRLAYYKEIPDQVCICSLFWRMIIIGAFMLIFKFLIFCSLFIFAIVGSLIWLVTAVASFFFAKKPVTHSIFDLEFEFRDYKYWPTIRGVRIWPISVVGLAGVLYGLFASVDAVLQNREAIGTFLTSYCAMIIGVIIVLVMIEVMRSFNKSDAGKITKAWLKAKKQKICPLVQIVERENKEGTNTEKSR